jgi:hypothetical protein
MTSLRSAAAWHPAAVSVALLETAMATSAEQRNLTERQYAKMLEFLALAAMALDVSCDRPDAELVNEDAQSMAVPVELSMSREAGVGLFVERFLRRLLALVGVSSAEVQDGHLVVLLSTFDNTSETSYCFQASRLAITAEAVKAFVSAAASFCVAPL